MNTLLSLLTTPLQYLMLLSTLSWYGPSFVFVTSMSSFFSPSWPLHQCFLFWHFFLSKSFPVFNLLSQLPNLVSQLPKYPPHVHFSCNADRSFYPNRFHPKAWMTASESVSRSVMSDSLWPYRLQPARFLCPWDSPGKNTGGGCRTLLQGIFPTKGSNWDLLHCRQILYGMSYKLVSLSFISNASNPLCDKYMINSHWMATVKEDEE